MTDTSYMHLYTYLYNNRSEMWFQLIGPYPFYFVYDIFYYAHVHVFIQDQVTSFPDHLYQSSNKNNSNITQLAIINSKEHYTIISY